jgi:hypothetical protein
MGLGSDEQPCNEGVTRVYDDAGNVIEMLEHKGELKEW